MKLKVYKEEKDGEKIVRFKLCDEDNKINLIAVDEQGNRINCGQILSISTEGLHLHRNVNKDIGLPLVKNGIIEHYKL